MEWIIWLALYSSEKTNDSSDFLPLHGSSYMELIDIDLHQNNHNFHLSAQVSRGSVEASKGQWHLPFTDTRKPPQTPTPNYFVRPPLCIERKIFGMQTLPI